MSAVPTDRPVVLNPLPSDHVVPSRAYQVAQDAAPMVRESLYGGEDSEVLVLSAPRCPAPRRIALRVSPKVVVPTSALRPAVNLGTTQIN